MWKSSCFLVPVPSTAAFHTRKITGRRRRFVKIPVPGGVPLSCRRRESMATRVRKEKSQDEKIKVVSCPDTSDRRVAA